MVAGGDGGSVFLFEPRSDVFEFLLARQGDAGFVFMSRHDRLASRLLPDRHLVALSFDLAAQPFGILSGGVDAAPRSRETFLHFEDDLIERSDGIVGFLEQFGQITGDDVRQPAEVRHKKHRQLSCVGWALAHRRTFFAC